MLKTIEFITSKVTPEPGDHPHPAIYEKGWIRVTTCYCGIKRYVTFYPTYQTELGLLRAIALTTIWRHNIAGLIK